LMILVTAAIPTQAALDLMQKQHVEAQLYPAICAAVLKEHHNPSYEDAKIAEVYYRVIKRLDAGERIEIDQIPAIVAKTRVRSGRLALLFSVDLIADHPVEVGGGTRELTGEELAVICKAYDRLVASPNPSWAIDLLVGGRSVGLDPVQLAIALRGEGRKVDVASVKATVAELEVSGRNHKDRLKRALAHLMPVQTEILEEKTQPTLKAMVSTTKATVSMTPWGVIGLLGYLVGLAVTASALTSCLNPESWLARHAEAVATVVRDTVRVRKSAPATYSHRYAEAYRTESVQPVYRYAYQTTEAGEMVLVKEAERVAVCVRS
jgi:hypothetical protein